MKTTLVFFPFDLFGSPGTAEGVHLLADALREMVADNRAEKVPTRARTYNNRLRLKGCTFETMADYAGWRGRGRELVHEAFRSKDFLLWVAGNHLGVLPVYDELSGGEPSTLVIQLDAHLDIHHFHDCTKELSHGNFLLHCDGPLPPIINVGHRDLLLPADYTARYYRRTFSSVQAAVAFDAVLDSLRTEAAAAGRVFLDLDCDVFDPAHFPAVSQAVPFGLTPQQVLRVVHAVWSPKVAGVCLSEFEPGRDLKDQCLATLLWLIEYILLRRHEK
jgi:arginase family enzyme